MIRRIALVASVVSAHCMLWCTGARAQDVPGIEICTVEKTMERRTSCLQSNVDFLMKTITKLGAEHRQKIDAANRQNEGLKASLAALQKVVDDLQAAQKKPAEDANKKPDAPPAKDAAPAAKEGAPAVACADVAARHCEERSDEAIHACFLALDCFASLAMTGSLRVLLARHQRSEQ